MENSKNIDCWYFQSCEEECNGCIIYPQMKWQFDNSGLPKAKYYPIKLSPQACDRTVFSILADIRKDIDLFVEAGKNLYICGANPGNGKTSWAIKMLQTYLMLTAEGSMFNIRGMFVSVPDLILKLKDFDNPISADYKYNLRNVDLLVLDDIAVAGLSQYDYVQLFALIDNRMLSGKSTIFTSNNDSLEDLQDAVGERIASRIWNNSKVVRLRGGDMRG